MGALPPPFAAQMSKSLPLGFHLHALHDLAQVIDRFRKPA
jgi:hypothetical protein